MELWAGSLVGFSSCWARPLDCVRLTLRWLNLSLRFAVRLRVSRVAQSRGRGFNLSLRGLKSRLVTPTTLLHGCGVLEPSLGDY
jgi:hypothetical protein